jgi:hypothetical protein
MHALQAYMDWHILPASASMVEALASLSRVGVYPAQRYPQLPHPSTLPVAIASAQPHEFPMSPSPVDTAS